MKRKMVLAAPSNPSERLPVPEGEIVTVLAPGEAHLPRRRARPGLTTVERLAEWIDQLEASRQKPATIARKLALPAPYRTRWCATR